MKEKDEMFVLCEIKHYIDALLHSLDKLNKNPDDYTREYLQGFINYCKGYIEKYTREYADYVENKLKDSE